MLDQLFSNFFTSCILHSLTLRIVKIQLVFSVKKEQKEKWVWYKWVMSQLISLVVQFYQRWFSMEFFISYGLFGFLWQKIVLQKSQSIWNNWTPSEMSSDTTHMVWYKSSYVSWEILFYAYLTSFYQINDVRHLWPNLEKTILSVVTVKSGSKN